MFNRSLITLSAAMVLAGCNGFDAESQVSSGDEVSQGTSWEQFLSDLYQEPESGIFIVDGDTAIEDEKQLREFYEQNVQQGQLAVHRNGTTDAKWTATQRKNLTYCVSTTFGTNHTAAKNAMAQAAAAWEAAADVKFVYVAAQDGTCTATNSNVLFDVRPTNSNGEYTARAFFPGSSRSGRNVLIDNTAFNSSLKGVITHELGHVLGFRHEHTRPESGTCFEDTNWRALTPYDSASVMHYPQCNGTNSWWNLAITAKDKQGAVALYGAPVVADAGTTTTDAGTSTSTTTTTFSGSLAASAAANHGPITVVAGTTFKVVMTGSGDPDLYVRFGGAPTTSVYDCRPYLSGADETCEVTVPAGQNAAYLMVRGFSASTYSLAVTYAKVVAAPAPTGGTAKTVTLTGTVATDEAKQLAPITVVAGSTFTVNMTGSGDPDLHLKFGSAPTTTSYDCRPYKSGAVESCSVTVPAGQTKVYLMVNGYQGGNYSLDVSYRAP